MFDRITLGLSGDASLIQTRLYNHPECAFPISVTKDENEEAITYIAFEPADDVYALDQYLNVVAEYIIDRYENRLLKRILDENCGDLSAAARREVLKDAPRFMDDPVLGYTARKQAVLLSMYDYLKEDTTMRIDGFVAFRLKEYEALLEELAQRLVEEYVTRKEYEEFVELLKYFVNIQEKRPPLVHVAVQSGGGYVLMDADGRDITARCFADFLEGELMLTEEAYDDLLISVLITLAPQKIVVHNRKAIHNRELFGTIAQVFEGSLSYCEGCELCKDM